MAAVSSSSASGPPETQDPKRKLLFQVKQLEVAIAELNSLPPSRAVYQKKCGLFFRTDIQSATASQQRELDKVKTHLQKM